METLTHTDQLFGDHVPKVEKSHCCICHHEIGRPDKARLGNCCRECNARATKVSRGLLTEHESDLLLKYRMCDLQVETWIVDGVTYTKYPNGDLKIL